MRVRVRVRVRARVRVRVRVRARVRVRVRAKVRVRVSLTLTQASSSTCCVPAIIPHMESLGIYSSMWLIPVNTTLLLLPLQVRLGLGLG